MAKTKHTAETIRETFLTGVSGIIKTTGYKKIFFSNWITYTPIVISFIIVGFAILLKEDELKLLLEIKSIMLNFLPGILGFTIAGYSMMIAFIQVGMLDKITEPSKDSKFSLYQKMSSILAINILLQALALVIAYIFHFINYFDTNKGIPSFLSSNFISIINYIGVAILSYWFTISVLMIIQIVLNIFGFSQLHHYFVNKAKIDALADGTTEVK